METNLSFGTLDRPPPPTNPLYHLEFFRTPGIYPKCEARAMKSLTREQVEGRKEKAVRFVRDVLDDPDRADEIEDESVEDYAERRKFQIINPKSSTLRF